MTNADRLTVIQHGAIVMLIGLLAGVPTMLEHEPIRFWHTAHETIVFMGILMIAVSSVFPYIRLAARESRALVWSLLATGYGLGTGLITQAILGQHAFSPTTDPALMFGFLANITGMFGSVLSASLTLMGARAARRAMAPTPAGVSVAA
jgi:hypothetical protein